MSREQTLSEETGTPSGLDAGNLIDLQEQAFHRGRFLGYPALSQPSISAGAKAWAAFCYGTRSEAALEHVLSTTWPMQEGLLSTGSIARQGDTQAGKQAQPSI